MTVLVHVPGSKSIANRALVIAALADGQSVLGHVPTGDDTTALVWALRELGIDATAEPEADSGGDTVTVGGAGGRLRPLPGTRLDARLGGTTARLLTALAALADVPVTIDGDPPLRRRPMEALHAALRVLGVGISYGGAPGHLPVEVTGPLTGGTVALPGEVSSQFVTALMLVAPVLPGGLRIDVTSTLVSRPYVMLTATVMRAFGAGVDVCERTIVVPPGRYGGRTFDVEPDASSASYPFAIGALLAVPVTVAGLRRPMAQGDEAIVDLLERMGCSVTDTESGTTVSRDPATPLVGIDVDMSDISDLVPTVAAVAVAASTPTTIRGVGFIRAKESDRLGDLAAELTKVGADVTETDDGLRINPVAPGALHGARLGTHHDHRLAMAFAVLGSVVDGIELDEPAVVSKSWPAFWSTYDRLVTS